MDGVLYRYCSEQETENGQLVVPKSIRSAILWQFHDDPESIMALNARFVEYYHNITGKVCGQTSKKKKKNVTNVKHISQQT